MFPMFEDPDEDPELSFRRASASPQTLTSFLDMGPDCLILDLSRKANLEGTQRTPLQSERFLRISRCLLMI